MSDSAPASPIPEIKWGDPPPIRRYRPSSGPGGKAALLVRYSAFFDALRARPGEWALFDVKPPKAAASARAYRASVLRPHGFEIVTRKVDGEGHTYIRYVGGDS